MAAPSLSSDGTRELLTELARPQAFPGSVRRVERRETHASWLFFTEERVYKVKKPVDFGFLDFSTLARRHHFCLEELRLNRRLAADVYLDVVPITRSGDGHLVLGGSGPALEWAVEMERLPSGRMLAALLERGAIDNQDLNALVDLLVPFHAAAPTGPGVDEYGTPEALASPIEQNFEQLAEFVGPGADSEALTLPQLEHLTRRARAFLTDQRALFLQRVKAGRIREGHGDLHAENLCLLADGPVAYDCLEFDRALRCSDVASEVGFLAMDLDRRGFPGFARYLVHRYAERAGDSELPRLIDFYKGYRAVVRGKVAALTARGLARDDPQRPGCVAEARRALQLAVGYELPPLLLLMAGLPASGKSTVAAALAGPLRARVLSSDQRRRHVTAGLPTGVDVGKYAPEQRQRVYDSLRADAEHTLTRGGSVIVDATFATRASRASFVAAAERLGLPWCLVEVTATEAETRERMTQRTPSSGGSEADIEVWERARGAFEPPEELCPTRRMSVASGAGCERMVSTIFDRLVELS